MTGRPAPGTPGNLRYSAYLAQRLDADERSRRSANKARITTILRMATSEPARHFGPESTHGHVGVGRRADLVLLEDDPHALSGGERSRSRNPTLTPCSPAVTLLVYLSSQKVLTSSRRDGKLRP
ncbi:amidohydrolase family protein [Gordonia polyisoprenivorans]|uniref:amidohydrolase family protein n=1 Tax=Gordonia polyisoprenivorans TaxID=84595 RepID=UPI003A5B9C42